MNTTPLVFFDLKIIKNLNFFKFKMWSRSEFQNFIIIIQNVLILRYKLLNQINSILTYCLKALFYYLTQSSY